MSDETKKAPRARVEQEDEAMDVVELDEGSGPEPRKNAASSSPEVEQPAGAEKASALERLSAWLSASFPGHENAIVGGFAGLLVAVFMMVVGFWQTVLVLLLVVVGVAVGQQLDGDPKIIRMVSRFFRGRRN